MRILIYLVVFLSILSVGFAQETFENYNVLSPEGAERLVYSTENPPFQISAPSGWYMAEGPDDSPLGKVLFTPYKLGTTEDIIPKGYIAVIFAPNKDKVSVKHFAQEVLDSVEKNEGKVMSPREDLVIDNNAGSHVTAETFPGMIQNVYIFEKGQNIICIQAVSSIADSLKLKEKIEESINSIKFRAVPSKPKHDGKKPKRAYRHKEGITKIIIPKGWREENVLRNDNDLVGIVVLKRDNPYGELTIKFESLRDLKQYDYSLKSAQRRFLETSRDIMKKRCEANRRVWISDEFIELFDVPVLIITYSKGEHVDGVARELEFIKNYGRYVFYLSCKKGHLASIWKDIKVSIEGIEFGIVDSLRN